MAGASADSISDLFRKYGPLVRRRARRLLGSDSDADEVLQEVFIRAMDHLGDFDREDGTRWFYRVTTNLCLNQIRDRKRRAELLATRVQPAEQERDNPRPDGMMTLRWLLERGDEREATCAVYVYLDELPHDEAAEMLGVSPRTVRNLLQRFNGWARQALDGGLTEGA